MPPPAWPGHGDGHYWCCVGVPSGGLVRRLSGGLVVGIGRTVLDGFSRATLAGSSGAFQASFVFAEG
jgi:hypothetical protein